MKDVFQILPKQPVQRLNLCLDNLFVCQSDESNALVAVAANLDDDNLGTLYSGASTRVGEAEEEGNDVDIVTISLIRKFQDLYESTIHKSNKYYAMYGTEGSIENLSWSAEKS